MITPAITLALALVPSWLLVRYFHDRDYYPEPPRVIWTTFALGALTVIPVLLFVFPMMKLLPQPESHVGFAFQFAFLYAAIPEEFFKLMVLLGYSLRRRDFDEPMDGLVYGAVASQGFAALENVMYSFAGGVSIAVARAFTAVPAHACMGIIMGYFVGRARFEPERRTALIVTGYLAATLVHGIYDTPLMVINAIVMQFGEIPEDLSTLAGVCMLLGIAALVVSAAIARTLWGKARRHQLEHPVPPPLPCPPVAAPPPLPVPHPASIASPPEVRAVVLTRQPIQTTSTSVLKLVAGIVLSVFGGAVLFSCVHAFLDSSTDSRLYVNLGFALVLLGCTPLMFGLRLFRSGVRGLNAPVGGGPNPPA
ncbi:MAG: PrsW family intramembrane metalloprotease [Candidatus Hydrogenedentes bacterium]|nr:PrsW family intramembrane metalloprotease [Candidatus Hydrogenedentota bacterium]